MDSNVHGGFIVPMNMLQLLYFTIISENRFMISCYDHGRKSRYRRKSSSTKHEQMFK